MVEDERDNTVNQLLTEMDGFEAEMQVWARQSIQPAFFIISIILWWKTSATSSTETRV